MTEKSKPFYVRLRVSTPKVKKESGEVIFYEQFSVTVPSELIKELGWTKGDKLQFKRGRNPQTGQVLALLLTKVAEPPPSTTSTSVP